MPLPTRFCCLKAVLHPTQTDRTKDLNISVRLDPIIKWLVVCLLFGIFSFLALSSGEWLIKSKVLVVCLAARELWDFLKHCFKTEAHSAERQRLTHSNSIEDWDWDLTFDWYHVLYFSSINYMNLKHRSQIIHLHITKIILSFKS